MVQISTLGLSLQSAIQIRNAQAQLSDLSTQLATGKISLNLADYQLSESRRILDFRGVIEKRDSFLNVIGTVEPRLKVYDTTFGALNDIGNQALRMVNTTQNAENADSEAVGEQIAGFLDQAQYHLNQKLGDRFLFAGSRYTTAPVGDWRSLPTTPVDSSTPVTDPTLPSYDSAAPGNSAASYEEATAKIDDNYTITYGISSNESAFQKLVLGLRWAYAATQDPDNFAANMENARGLLADGLSEMRSLHGEVTSNLGKLVDTKALHVGLISSAESHIDDIQRADSAEVATKITFVQAQLQASYSATARIASLSLTNYL